MPALKRIYLILGVIALAAAAVFATRYARHQHDRKLALSVVAELGGKVGSITAPFGGTEYYISFAGCTLTKKNIDRLVVLKPLVKRGDYITISLEDAIISTADLKYLKCTLLEVHILPLEIK